jgi:SecD/SecF fusion protein
MDPNVRIFLFGLLLLVLFGWYFFTDSERAKRILGTVLTVLITGFCLALAYPPFDVKDANGKVLELGKIHLGLDLQGGTSFLIRLDPPMVDGEKKAVTKDMVDQAMEAIRKRVDSFGVSEPIITPQGTARSPRLANNFGRSPSWSFISFIRRARPTSRGSRPAKSRPPWDTR